MKVTVERRPLPVVLDPVLAWLSLACLWLRCLFLVTLGIVTARLGASRAGRVWEPTQSLNIFVGAGCRQGLSCDLPDVVKFK